jgi:hypothetical protein
MNNMIHTSNDRLRFDLVSELLKGLEGEKSMAEMLSYAEKLFIKDVSDKEIIQARQRIALLKQRYSQEKMKDDEAKSEISGILLMLT